MKRALMKSFVVNFFSNSQADDLQLYEKGIHLYCLLRSFTSNFEIGFFIKYLMATVSNMIKFFIN